VCFHFFLLPYVFLCSTIDVVGVKFVVSIFQGFVYLRNVT